MNKKRPVNLDMASLKYPPMAIASILHRISGVVLFLLLPMMIFILGHLIKSEESFTQMMINLSHPEYKIMVWAFSVALVFHLLAGMRHLLMDLGWGDDLNTGRRSAILIIILSIIFTFFLGIWVW